MPNYIRWIGGAVAVATALAVTMTDTPAADEKPSLTWKVDKATAGPNGVQVGAFIEVKGGTIIEYNLLHCGIDRFVDDKGTALGDKPVKQFYGTAGVLSVERRVAPDGLTRLTLFAKGKPAAGAVEVTIEGTLDVWFAAKTRTGRTGEAALEAGSKFKFETIEMTVRKSKSGMNFFKEMETTVELTFKVDKPFHHSAFEELKVAGAAAKAAVIRRGNSLGSGVAGEHMMTWKIPGEVKKAAIEYTMWTDAARMQLPIKLKAALK